MKSRSILWKTLGVLFLVPVFISSATAATVAPFADVDATSLPADALVYLKEQGAIQGYEDGTFRPEQTMNRAEALKMLYVGVKEPIDLEGEAEQVFPDVPVDEWFAPYVEHAQSQGVVKGYPDGTFKPGNTINKAEALKILLNIVQEDTDVVTADAIAAYSKGQQLWYAPFLLRSHDLGLIDALNPEDYTLAGDITRGELAEMLYRVLYIREEGLETYPLYDTGIVSYYSETLTGNSTSSGEKYDPLLFTAAHREAPLKSFIQVIDNVTKKSMLVRVNDRGPGDTKGVADLSRTAFEVFYKTSKGIFDGTVYRLPAQIQTAPKTYVRSDVFAGITLKEPMPNIFWQNEMYLLEVAEADSPSLSLKSPSGAVEVLDALPAQGKTVYQFSFAEQGTYVLERAGATPKRVNLHAVAPFQGKHIAEAKIEAPTFTVDRTGVPALMWSKPMPGVLLRINVMQGNLQRTVYVNAGTTQYLRLYGAVFKDFDMDQNLHIGVEGARTSTRFSHDIFTPWEELAILFDYGKEAVSNDSPSIIEPNAVPSANYDQYQKDILKRVNEERAKAGVAPVQLDTTLSAMATAKSKDMVDKGYFAHANPAGEDVNDWKDDFQWKPMVAENIAYSTEGVMANVENLIKSPGHYANMVDSRFEIMGIGIAVGGGKTYLTQHFSTVPVTATDLKTARETMQQAVRGAGITVAYDATLAGVAQRWSEELSARQRMSFTLGGKDVADVLESEVGPAGYSMAIYADVGTASLEKNLVEKMKGFSGTAGYGLGLSQDGEGMIRLSIIIKK